MVWRVEEEEEEGEESAIKDPVLLHFPIPDDGEREKETRYLTLPCLELNVS